MLHHQVVKIKGLKVSFNIRINIKLNLQVLVFSNKGNFVVIWVYSLAQGEKRLIFNEWIGWGGGGVKKKVFIVLCREKIHPCIIYKIMFMSMFQDSCVGDSGSALMRNNLSKFPDQWEIIGVVSFGPRFLYFLNSQNSAGDNWSSQLQAQVSLFS